MTLLLYLLPAALAMGVVLAAVWRYAERRGHQAGQRSAYDQGYCRGYDEGFRDGLDAADYARKKLAETDNPDPQPLV